MDHLGRVLFMGSKPLGADVLREMHALSPGTLIGALTIDDRSDPRSAFDTIRDYCSESDVPCHVAANRRHAEELIREIRPDLCIVVGWYWLITEETLAEASGGFIGIHNSLLPAYRGVSPLVWSIINGEDVAGFSLFSFTVGMDEGEVWAQGSVPVGADDYVADVLGAITGEILKTFRRVYPSLLDGTAVSEPQDPGKATYCAARTASDGEIDWQQPARRIYDFIRAQSEPYPGAFTYFDGQRLTIWKARPFEPVYYGTPGQVARVDSEGVYVICGDNRALVLQEVGLAGQRSTAASVIRSIRTRFPRIGQEPAS